MCLPCAPIWDQQDAWIVILDAQPRLFFVCRLPQSCLWPFMWYRLILCEDIPLLSCECNVTFTCLALHAVMFDRMSGWLEHHRKLLYNLCIVDRRLILSLGQSIVNGSLQCSELFALLTKLYHTQWQCFCVWVTTLCHSSIQVCEEMKCLQVVYK